MKTDIRKTVSAILARDKNGVQYAIDHIHDSVLKGGGPGVLGAARVYVKGVMPFDPPVVNPRLIQINEYYKTIQAMGVHLLVEAYLASDPNEYSKSAAKQGAQDALDTFDRYAKLKDAAVAKLRREADGTVEDMRTKLIWLQAPVINLPESESPSDRSGWQFLWNFHDVAVQQCRGLAATAYAGYSGWRLPTDPEVHKVIHGSPNKTGNADGGRGIFKWLLEQGFQAEDSGSRVEYLRGFSADPRAVYFSSTGSGTGAFGVYYEALWDTGVDFACVHQDCYWYPSHRPAVAGAWCVTEGKSE